MAYDKKKILIDAKELIEKHHLIFMSDVIGLLPVVEQTFYTYFPKHSEELESLKNILEKNRIRMKANMRKKWYQSDNATLQVALMKLIATDAEASRLCNSNKDNKIDQKSTVELIWGKPNEDKD